MRTTMILLASLAALAAPAYAEDSNAWMTAYTMRALRAGTCEIDAAYPRVSDLVADGCVPIVVILIRGGHGSHGYHSSRGGK